MSTQFILIILVAIAIFGGMVASALISIHFSEGQLRRFPILYKLRGKQIYYLLTVIVAASASGALLVWQYYSNQADIELGRSPYGDLESKASYALFNRDVGKGSASNEARDYFRAAERSIRSGRYKEAAEEYELSIKSVPSVAAQLNLGIAYQYLGDFNKAEAILLTGLQQCRKSDYGDVEPAFLATLGVVYTAKGELKEALSKSEQARQLGKDDAIVEGTVLNNIGKIYVLQAKFPDALNAYLAALQFISR